MRMHTVEVDDEIFRFVQQQAEPLVDTFNSALRRLLLSDESNKHLQLNKQDADELAREKILPSMPSGTPKALQYILEVVQLVQSGTYNRVAATQFISKQHGISASAVNDKYGRQLQLTARQFDRLLEQENFADLKKLLKSKFPEYIDIITKVLN